MMTLFRHAAAAAALAAATSGALAASFSATYVVHMAVDATRASPNNATERAMVKGAAMLGRFEVATVTDTGSLTGDSFRLRSAGVGSRALRTLIPDDRLEVDRRSEAVVRDGSLVTLRFSDRRGSSPQITYSADLRRKRYEMRRGADLTHAGALREAVVDIAALPYLFLGRPAPTAAFAVAYTDAKSIKQAEFQLKRESMEVDGRTVAVTRLTSAARGPDEPLIEIWLRDEDSFPLRVRVGVSAQYAAVLDQQIKTLPPVFRRR